MPIEIDSIDRLIDHISGQAVGLITVDGRDGSGKTYLASELHKRLGSLHLTEADFRTTDLEGHFVPELEELKAAIGKASDDAYVIFDSCLMLSTLESLGIEADISIYVKKLSPMGLWSDVDEVGCERPRDEALKRATNMGATEFRIQVIDYHYDYEPHLRSDVVYLRAG